MARPNVTIYHNPRCGKSRAALKLIQDAGIEPDVVLYLETPPTPKRLAELIHMLGIQPIDLVRTKEPIARELGIGAKNHTDKQLIDLMVANPILIERPIVVKGRRAVLGRPPENVRELL